MSSYGWQEYSWLAGSSSPSKPYRKGLSNSVVGIWWKLLIFATGDEIERLAETFNSMAGNLQRSFSQLNQKVEEIGRLEEKYRDLIENAPEMIHQLDPSGRFVHVNSTELQKLGYSLSQMLDMSLWDIVPHEHQEAVKAYVRALALHGPRTIETVFRTQSQKMIEVEIHSTTLVDSDTQAIVFSRGFVRDITHRKVLEKEVARYTNQLEDLVTQRTQQLSDSEAGYKALFNLAADSIFVVDLEGRVVDGNARAREIFGYAPSEFAGESFVKLVAQKFSGDQPEFVRTGESRGINRSHHRN